MTHSNHGLGLTARPGVARRRRWLREDCILLTSLPFLPSLPYVCLSQRYTLLPWRLSIQRYSLYTCRPDHHCTDTLFMVAKENSKLVLVSKHKNFKYIKIDSDQNFYICMAFYRTMNNEHSSFDTKKMDEEEYIRCVYDPTTYFTLMMYYFKCTWVYLNVTNRQIKR